MPHNYFHPRYWPGWLAITLAWCLVHLPVPAQFWLGKQIGRLTFIVGGSRKKITQTNIRLCFPELDENQRALLVRDIFLSTGINAMESAMAWIRSPCVYQHRMQIQGLELLKAAQREGKGVLLVGAHYSSLEVAGALLSTVADYDIMYRRSNNPQIESLMTRGRKRLYQGVIDRKNTRQILRRLKQGATIWYGPDQDYGRKHSIFVPFFGVEAATITATSRLAQFNNSAVLHFSHFRNTEECTWSLSISPVPGFPSGDAVTDATLINSIIETEIRKHPEQYLWLHRRFKTRPEGEPRPYNS